MRGLDLTGRKFGNLTAISLAEPIIGKTKRWNCECDCGVEGCKKTVVVFRGNLMRRHTRSCGAWRTLDLSGKVFGNLTVLRRGDDIEIKETPRRPMESSKAKWWCECRCGDIGCRGSFQVVGSNLMNGNTRSCVHKYDYLIGRRFGKLVVISISKNTRLHRRMAHCKCDCGNEVETVASALRGNVGKHSCGCARYGYGTENAQWGGTGEISGRYWRAIRYRAASRGLSFDVTFDDIWSLFKDQEGRCALSGVKIKFPDSVDREQTASLDRIKSSIGYEKGNIQWVHKDINIMKQDFEEEVFLGYCKLIVNKANSAQSSDEGLTKRK